MFSPRVLSIEDFAEEVSGLNSIDNTTVLFEFYTAYLSCTPKENIEDFDTFSSWAQTLLYDFNEIDRYLIDYRSFFDYLGEIQEMNHWYLQQERTELMNNYLRFWNRLPEYYEKLQSQLKTNNLAYQGMVYRAAAEKIGPFLQEKKGPFLLVGFNALNTAEQHIFQAMLSSGKAEVIWDIDEVFYNDKQHDVSRFIRSYRASWPYYKDHPFKEVTSEYSGEKRIEITAVPKNVGQAKLVGEILSQMHPDQLRQTAVVLGDENLLLPVISALPPQVEQANITMGYALANAPVSHLFQQLLHMHSGSSPGTWYFKDLMLVLNHPICQQAVGGVSEIIMQKIKKENMVYVSTEVLLKSASEDAKQLYQYLFADWKDDALLAVDYLQQILSIFKAAQDPEEDRLSLQFLYQFNLLFNQVINLLQEYPYVRNIKTLVRVYKDLLSSRTVDFRGQPFSGLQIMGVLESRVLDFKHVIVTSVNEGILPAGRTANSYIPFDLKCAYKLPTYKEKDAVYAYHFYHLLHRAENIHLLYNSESSGINAGEKSRFLRQLEMEQQPKHDLLQTKMIPRVPSLKNQLKVIAKSPGIMQRMKNFAAYGFSPSALTTYMRNPLDFYKQYILGLREPVEVEETVAYNTLGTVVHDSLENIYRQWIGQQLTLDLLAQGLEQVEKEVDNRFRDHYSEAPLDKGQNLLISQVAKRYLINFLKSEMKFIKNGNVVEILQLENKYVAELPIKGLEFPVRIRGTVDRVDRCNGRLRVIDYKTGRVEKSKVEIIDWTDICSDYDQFSKSFQILMYTLLLDENRKIETAEAGIISFKNLQAGFLKFAKKEKKGQQKGKDSTITQETLAAFRLQLENFIWEICNADIPFTEKELKQTT